MASFSSLDYKNASLAERLITFGYYFREGNFHLYQLNHLPETFPVLRETADDLPEDAYDAVTLALNQSWSAYNQMVQVYKTLDEETKNAINPLLSKDVNRALTRVLKASNEIPLVKQYLDEEVPFSSIPIRHNPINRLERILELMEK